MGDTDATSAPYTTEYINNLQVKCTPSPNNELEQRNEFSHVGNIQGFECDVCFAVLSTVSVLQRHKRTHPQKQADRKHHCHQCADSTDDLTRLRQHLLTHSGERPHRCTLCHKAFTQKHVLQAHLRLHTGERPYICSTCGRDFNTIGNLRRHERIHSGEKPYICPICGRQFNESGNLKRHELHK